jgi:methylmalonyl-CoA mutase
MTNRKSLELDSLEAFSPAGRADWLYVVEKGLDKSGITLGSLTEHTEDGIARGPLFTLESRHAAPAPIMRAGEPLLDGRPWHICTPVSDPDLAFANQQLIEDLEGGASAARIELAEGKEDGLHISRAADFERLFERVHTVLIPLRFAGITPAQVEMLLSLPALRAAHVTLGLSPLMSAGDLAAAVEKYPPHWRAVVVSGAKAHEDGAAEVQELAFAAASLVQALSSLSPTIGLDRAASQISAEIAVSCDAHLMIAKTRAIRRIFARILENYGLENRNLPLSAISSARMMQSTDPWTNMLRMMSAGFGAVIGGADYLTLRPFTHPLGEASSFGYRNARNMQLMMMEESRLGAAADPAHGSYTHERLTHDLAEAAWVKFQSIEAGGGAANYVDSGAYAADCKIAIKRRNAAERPIVGVTLHRTEAVRAPKLRGTRS